MCNGNCHNCSSEKAVKNDEDYEEKPPMQLLPATAIEEMARCFGYGAMKYGVNNYKKGDCLPVERLLGAAIRHIYRHLDHDVIDEESGRLHLGHAMSDIAMAIDVLIIKAEEYGRNMEVVEDEGTGDGEFAMESNT
jgi:hypothetical protein